MPRSILKFVSFIKGNSQLKTPFLKCEGSALQTGPVTSFIMSILGIENNENV